MRIQYENCTSGASSLKATISDKYFPSFIIGIPLQKKKRKHKEQSIISTSQQNVHYCEALKAKMKTFKFIIIPQNGVLLNEVLVDFACGLEKTNLC